MNPAVITKNSQKKILNVRGGERARDGNPNNADKINKYEKNNVAALKIPPIRCSKR
jgi:hypothetical protein